MIDTSDKIDPGVLRFAAFELATASFGAREFVEVTPTEIVKFAQGRDIGERQPNVLGAIESKSWAASLFGQARVAYSMGYSRFAKAASTTAQGVRRQLGDCALQVVQDGPGWFIVVSLANSIVTPPKRLLVGEPPQMHVLPLNAPIDGFIQQPVQPVKNPQSAQLLSSLLNPDTVLSLQ